MEAGMAEPIDRSKVRDPSEVSGWGPREGQRSRQDYDDIARVSETKPEFERGRSTSRGRADGTPREQPASVEDGG
jgi:hypothetical protein